MGDIFREIDDELRQERFETLWRRYGKYVIAGAVVIVVAVAGIQGWNYYRTDQRQAESARFSAASSLMRDGKNQDAAALFAALAENADTGYAVLARFNQATLRARSGDLAGAVALFDGIAADDDVSGALRGAATISAVLYGMDAEGADTAALQARLQPLIDSGGPWRHSAAELSALLALRAGDGEKARTLVRGIVDDVEAPQHMRARASEILAVIGE